MNVLFFTVFNIKELATMDINIKGIIILFMFEKPKLIYV